jgi:hypothetical protein
MDRYTLIPELKAWDAHNGGEISPESWASCMGNYSLAIAYATVFWPQFVEIDGMIFREGITESEVRAWSSSTHNNKKTVEATINHLHILDIQHPGAWLEASEAQVRFLGETLRSAWAAKLSIDYPERKFVVALIDGSPTDLREYQVVFYQTEA